VLVAQGWTPGQTLGNTESAYAEHYTAASASHIRVLLKDDFLGLGAKRGKADGETFGLELLSGLLGRLNGKSDGQLQKEENARRDVKLMTYVGQRGKGMSGFVSGGFLVGDKIEETLESTKITATISSDADQKSKKRKRSAPENKLVGEATGTKENDKSQNSTQEDEDESTAEGSDEEIDSELSAKRMRKQERRARREARQTKRSEKLARKESRRLRREAKQHISETSEDSGVGISSTPAFDEGRGRNIIRQRYIQQKRMSCMDPQALKEVSSPSIIHSRD
jgi:Pin2-interacting protein X1